MHNILQDNYTYILRSDVNSERSRTYPSQLPRASLLFENTRVRGN